MTNSKFYELVDVIAHKHSNEHPDLEISLSLFSELLGFTDLIDKDIHSLYVWLHFTDWRGEIDIDRLIVEDLIRKSPIVDEEGWKKYSPHYRYTLTVKALAILLHPGKHVKVSRK